MVTPEASTDRDINLDSPLPVITASSVAAYRPVITASNVAAYRPVITASSVATYRPVITASSVAAYPPVLDAKVAKIAKDLYNGRYLSYC